MPNNQRELTMMHADNLWQHITYFLCLQKNLCTVQNRVRINEEQWRKDINVQFSLHKEKEKSEEKGRKIDSTHGSSQMRKQLCLFTEFKVALIQSILGVLATETSDVSPALKGCSWLTAQCKRCIYMIFVFQPVSLEYFEILSQYTRNKWRKMAPELLSHWHPFMSPWSSLNKFLHIAPAEVAKLKGCCKHWPYLMQTALPELAGQKGSTRNFFWQLELKHLEHNLIHLKHGCLYTLQRGQKSFSLLFCLSFFFSCVLLLLTCKHRIGPSDPKTLISTSMQLKLHMHLISTYCCLIYLSEWLTLHLLTLNQRSSHFLDIRAQ